ncbi:restriction endonuclease subunit S [Bifidobacterium bifidum]|uniref:restriction endonuclease subunit S n=1 Tax=Bifidobacterium bifidum TaxID=1681 RepID=UPI00232E06C0|nr:restriction endonuclease subunit S [Bifidobacterium bifidum]MDB1267070.1 restriction endonuclease subunit S [Bifidobacterium bifidum]
MTEQAKVPSIRFAGFTDPWEQRKLGDVADIKTGPFGTLLHAEDYVDDGIPIVTTEHFKTGALPKDKEGIPQVSEEDAKRLEQYRAKEGDILFSRVGSVDANAQVFAGQDGWLFSGRVLRARPDLTLVSSAYLHYELETEEVKSSVISRAVGGTMASINTEILFQTPIFIPAKMTEQNKIGSTCARLDSLITLHQRKYDKLVVFKKSMLEKMFPKDGESVPEIRFAGFTDPWEQRKLGDVTDSFSGGTPDGSHASYYGGSIPFIRSAEINSDKTELFLTEKGLDNSSAKIVERGTVLYALYGATSGEVGIAAIKGAINQAILALSPHTGNDPLFLASWLRREKARIVDTYLQGGQGNLSGSIVKELSFALPQQKEQQVIGSFFSHLDNLITLHQRKLELLRNIKKSLLDKMFV